eukprot:1137585-Pelagomonas_calceolata.AAC.2
MQWCGDLLEGARLQRECHVQHFCTAAAQMPLFLVASAAESKQPSNSVPTWRSTVGNLAAGAIAGCAVESGIHIWQVAHLPSWLQQSPQIPYAVTTQ